MRQFLVVILALAMAACSSADPTPAGHTATATPIVSESATATPTAGETPTLTPTDSSPTTEPTPTATPTSAPTADPVGHTDNLVAIERAFSALTFPLMTDMRFPDDGSGRLFVTLQPGQIMVFANDQAVSSSETFLDISEQVNDEGPEEGLLGLAFDPNYRDNGYFYVYYTATDPRRSILSRFSVMADEANMADPNSETIILTVPQPDQRHNGGGLVFGPDNYLYLGLGDGGYQGGGSANNSQDLSTLYGSILRLDVSSPEGDRLYAIPPDNPFVGDAGGAREEIWAYGLRNPWRFTFHPETDDLYVADVGGNFFEEVNVVSPGLNYGWPITEGPGCRQVSSSETCDTEGLETPVTHYSHEFGCAIIGGYFYQGSRVPSLQGEYVFADLCTGRVWSLGPNEPEATQPEELFQFKEYAEPGGGLIYAFGQDQAGEIYILSNDGKIYRLVSEDDVLFRLAEGSPVKGNWSGSRVTDARKVTASNGTRIVEADFSAVPDSWTQIAFTASEPFDWADFEELSTQVRWSPRSGFGVFSISLDDEAGHRWAWSYAASNVETADNGWQTWDLRRNEATLKDDGFDWERLRMVRISARADAESSEFQGTVEVGPINRN